MLRTGDRTSIVRTVHGVWRKPMSIVLIVWGVISQPSNAKRKTNRQRTMQTVLLPKNRRRWRSKNLPSNQKNPGKGNISEAGDAAGIIINRGAVVVVVEREESFKFIFFRSMKISSRHILRSFEHQVKIRKKIFVFVFLFFIFFRIWLWEAEVYRAQ